MSAVNIFVLLAVKFRECSHARHGEGLSLAGSVLELTVAGEKRDLPRDEFYTILVVIFLFFTIIFVFSMFETIATPMFDKYYGYWPLSSVDSHSYALLAGMCLKPAYFSCVYLLFP